LNKPGEIVERIADVTGTKEAHKEKMNAFIATERDTGI
jgi:hypothetical protein